MTLAKTLAIAAVSSIGLASSPASAIPLAGGSTLGVNYDFTAQTPPPPYASGYFGQVGVVTSNGGDSSLVIFSVYDGLNGSGALVLSGSGPQLSPIFTNPLTTDGIFSILITAPAVGDFDFYGRFFGCTTANTCTPTLNGTTFVPSTQVPEPASLALLGLGGLGLFGALRARRRA